jgi:hypothetical protein
VPEVSEVPKQQSDANGFHTGATHNPALPGMNYGYTPTPYTPSTETMSVNGSQIRDRIPHGYSPVAEPMPANGSQLSVPYGHAPTMHADGSQQSIVSNSQASSTTPMLAHMNSASSVRSYPISDAALPTTAGTSTSTPNSSDHPFVSNPTSPPTHIGMTAERRIGMNPVEPTSPCYISTSGMTEEQVKFVRELQGMNVPAAEIAIRVDNMTMEKQERAQGRYEPEMR